jgi:hypothetical protein
MPLSSMDYVNQMLSKCCDLLALPYWLITSGDIALVIIVVVVEKQWLLVTKDVNDMRVHRDVVVDMIYVLTTDYLVRIIRHVIVSKADNRLTVWQADLYACIYRRIGMMTKQQHFVEFELLDNKIALHWKKRLGFK